MGLAGFLDGPGAFQQFVRTFRQVKSNFVSAQNKYTEVSKYNNCRVLFRNGSENILDILDAFEEKSWFSIVSKHLDHTLSGFSI